MNCFIIKRQIAAYGWFPDAEADALKRVPQHMEIFAGNRSYQDPFIDQLPFRMTSDNSDIPAFDADRKTDEEKRAEIPNDHRLAILFD